MSVPRKLIPKPAAGRTGRQSTAGLQVTVKAQGGGVQHKRGVPSGPHGRPLRVGSSPHTGKSSRVSRVNRKKVSSGRKHTPETESERR